MDYQFKNGKFIIQKDGVYFSVLPEQVEDLLAVTMQIVTDNALLTIQGTQDKDKKDG